MPSSCGRCDASTFGAAAWAAAPVPVPLVGQPLLTAEQLELEIDAATAQHSPSAAVAASADDGRCCRQGLPHVSSRALDVDEAPQLRPSSGTPAAFQQEDARNDRFRSQSEPPMPFRQPPTSLPLARDTSAEEALKHIHPPADPTAAAADAAEDSRLTAGARLSAQQKRVLVDLREAIYTNLGRLRRRRSRLIAELQELLLATCSSPAAAKGLDVFQEAGASARFSSALRVFDDVKTTFRDEHCCFLKATYLICTQVLTSGQGAFLAIQAHPQMVRFFSITEIVAAELKARSVPELLICGAQDETNDLISLEDVLPACMAEFVVPPPDAGHA